MIRFGTFGALAWVVVCSALSGCAAPSTRVEARGAASALGEDAARAGAAACAGIPDDERSSGIFAHPERITAIEPMRRASWSKGPAQLVGAAVSLRATPGVTEQWLGRVVVCNQTYQNSVHATGGGMKGSFRAFEGAELAVRSDRLGFRVEITVPNRDRALAIYQSAQTLARP